jgi:hypothetical protein
MTPQERELIMNIARKLANSPTKSKDNEAESLINQEIASQPDIVYKLTQAVLVQEMAIKELKQKADYLEKSSNYYKDESNRGTFSKLLGGNSRQPMPQPPQPAQNSGAFGGFMKTAAGVAAGMVAGHFISDFFSDHDKEQQPEEVVENNIIEPEQQNEEENPGFMDENNGFNSNDGFADNNENNGFLDNDSGFDGGFANNNSDDNFFNRAGEDSFQNDSNNDGELV